MLTLSGILVAMLVVAIVGVIAYCIATFIPLPPPFKTLIYVLGGLFCLLYLLGAIGVVSPISLR